MIDTHAHLLSLENPEQVVKNMSEDGLEYIVTIGTTSSDSKESVLFAQNHKNIYAVVGIYPEFSTEIDDNDLSVIESLAANEKVVAIGEIGLDYHGENYDKESQKELFIKQLEIADKFGLPFCIHCRSAVQDVYEILKEHKHLINHSGIMHCYSEGSGWFKLFIDLGLYLSFSGNITFKKNDREFLKKIPLDRILVETDSPYLSPEPVRGTPNEPKNVRYVIDKIAYEIGISSDELEKITSENAKRFYFKINKD